MCEKIAVIETVGHLALQEETRIQSISGLRLGDIIRLKAAKPVDERPYGWAEVLVIEGENKYTVRRFS